MIKDEMVKLLTNKYGYNTKELKDDKGNFLKNSELEKMIESEELKAKENEEKVKSPKKEENIFGVDETIFEKRHEFGDNDLILCMSGVNGEMNFISKLSNFRVKTNGFGQTMKIPYGDLSYVHNIAPDAFESGRIIVLNKEVQEEFGLSNLYKKVLTPKNIRAVINMNADDLRDFIADMPRAMKTSLYDEARKLYQQGRMDSMKTIKIFEDEFGVSFDDNAPIEGTIKK